MANLEHSSEPVPALATVACFLNPSDALVAESVLRAYGVPVVLADAHYCRQDWMFAVGIGGVRVQTPFSEREAALALLEPQLRPDAWADREMEGIADSFLRRVTKPTALGVAVAVLAAVIVIVFLTASRLGAASVADILSLPAVVASWVPNCLAPAWARGRRWRDMTDAEGEL